MLWIKALHVLAVIAWLAGIFYLPRIFVHYAEGRAHGEDVRRLIVMARRLFGFMTMMAVIALLLGLWLWLGFHDSGLWLMVKLLFVLALIGYHIACRVLLGRLIHQRPMPGSLALRLFNESALLIVVPIILLAVVKPF
ncbi:MAG TPA: CopD family protein [Steroidobacteraceae bacterium]|jgi:putative membrane protein|nr:CopD family protein [Steroidobacteraceae bacterium]